MSPIKTGLLFQVKTLPQPFSPPFEELIMDRVKILIFLAVLFATLLGGASAVRAEGLQVRGGHELGVTGVLSRSSGNPPYRGWLGGFALSYGYFFTNFLQAEVQGQFDIGDLQDTGVVGGGVLGGVNFYLNRWTRFLPFAGLKLGIGVLQNDLSGRQELNPTITLAPRAGFLFLIKEWIGLTASFEYQRVIVPANSFPDLNLIRIPVGVSFLF